MKEDTKDYDHEAFFGGNSELVSELKTLGLPEIKRRLRTLCNTHVDRNNDDRVTASEIAEWIRYQQVRYVHEDTQRVWLEHDTSDEGNTLSWNDYVKQAYSGIKDWNQIDQNGHTFQQNIDRDRRKWEIAKERKEGKNIDVEDFSAFLHPEHFPRMHEIYIQELLEDLDTNQDSKISLGEYIADLTTDVDENDIRDDDKEWIEHEKEMFSKVRDSDQDGFMDFGEIKQWILPDEIDHADSEAQRLIGLVLDRKNGDLESKYIRCDDLVKYHDIFIESSLTDWGEFLLRHREF